jgi:hypothetical protein
VSEIEKSFGKTHTIAQCEDCDWRTEGYKNGQAIAAIHAKKYGHKVSVEIGITGYYDGRKCIKEQK